MKSVSLAMLLVLLAGPALAQQKPMQRYGEPDPDKTPSELEAERKADRDYKRSSGNVPTAAPTDPWGGVRTDSKAAAKPAPVKPKKPSAAAN